jgi:group I intron endonuclease
MIGIYKVTNPKNRIYIGQSIEILGRLKNYKSLSKCKQQKRLYNSFKKYGYDAHKFELIEECPIELLNERERYWQDHYDVLSKKGLNCKLTKTNDKSGKMSNDSRKKMSESRKKLFESGWVHPMDGKKHSEETRKKLSENHKGKKLSEEHKRKISDGQKGRIPSEETRKKIGEKHKNKIVSKESRLKMSESQKKLNQSGYINPSSKMVIDLETGFIYNSIREAWEHNKDYIKIKLNSFTCKLAGANKNKTKFKII